MTDDEKNDIQLISYKTAFLVKKDWELNLRSFVWTKKGVTQQVKIFPYSSDPEEYEYEETSEFTLEEAFINESKFWTFPDNYDE